MAARHGLRLYATDDVMSDHASRCAPGDCPFLSEFAAMDMDERWVNRSPETMLETFGWFHGEGFGLIVEDLLRLPGEPGVGWASDGIVRAISLHAYLDRRHLDRRHLDRMRRRVAW
jgi:hypothetical protein